MLSKKRSDAMNKSSEDIKQDAEKDAVTLFNNIKEVYKDLSDDYVRHFYNKLAELRADL